MNRHATPPSTEFTTTDSGFTALSARAKRRKDPRAASAIGFATADEGFDYLSVVAPLGGTHYGLGALHNPLANVTTGGNLNADLTVANFTVEWFQTGAGRFNPASFSWGRGFPQDSFFISFQHNGAGGITADAILNYGGVSHGITGNTVATIFNDKIFHVAYSWDGGTSRLYVDGVLTASGAAGSGFTFTAAAGDAVNFRVGDDVAGSGYAKAREFALSNVARYTGASFSPPNPLGGMPTDGNTLHYWKCREGIGTNANPTIGGLTVPLTSNSAGGIWHLFAGVFA